MKYRFPRVFARSPSIGVNPNSRSRLPTIQNPVNATVIEAIPVAMMSKAHSG